MDLTDAGDRAVIGPPGICVCARHTMHKGFQPTGHAEPEVQPTVVCASLLSVVFCPRGGDGQGFLAFNKLNKGAVQRIASPML